jgi:hypothetical protein
MPLSRKELEDLLRLVGLTRQSEINCEQCLALVAEFAERRLEGKSIGESLRALEHHLSICGECRDEYEALERALKDMDD